VLCALDSQGNNPKISLRVKSAMGVDNQLFQLSNYAKQCYKLNQNMFA